MHCIEFVSFARVFSYVLAKPRSRGIVIFGSGVAGKSIQLFNPSATPPVKYAVFTGILAEGNAGSAVISQDGLFVYILSSSKFLSLPLLSLVA